MTVKTDTSTEIVQSVQERKKNEYKLRDLWDNTKSSGNHIILVSGGQRKNGVEKNVQIHKLTKARGSINPKLGNYKEIYTSKHHNHTVGN